MDKEIDKQIDKERNNSAAIGVLDSGLGGISVLREIWKTMPNENTIYIADSQNAPYGNKSIDFIQTRVLQLCNFLLDQKCKSIVIACNTATVNAASFIREHIKLDIPIIAVEPGVKPALQSYIAIDNQVNIGVLATYNTIKSAHLHNLIKKISDEYYIEHNIKPQFILQAGIGLVEEIENMNLSENKILDFSINNLKLTDLCKKCIDPMILHGVHTIVLGCTHYPFLLPILNILYPEIKFLETSKAIASHLQKVLHNKNFINHNHKQHISNYNIMYCSKNGNNIKKFMLGCAYTHPNNNLNFKTLSLC
jgi:glutamate racemase